MELTAAVTFDPQGVITAGAVIVAIGVIWRGGMALYRFIRKVDDTWRKVSVIAAETKPNGGSSLRDAVNAIQTDVTSIRTTVADHGRNIGRLDDRLDRLDARAEAMVGYAFANLITTEHQPRDPESRTRADDLPIEPEDYP